MKIKITLAIAAVIFLLSSPVYSINPVLISEVFYDTPLNESHELSQSKGMTHHNGEFIELFNPTLNDINLKGWKIYDSNTSFYLPENAHIAARGTILIAYQYPNSGFTLSSLFPSISGIPEAGKIYYQSSIELSNNGEEIWLVDPNGKTVDQMSYKYPTVKGVKANYWNISAKNYNWKEHIESNYLSLQRTEFQYDGNAFVPSAAYYSSFCASPLTTPSNANFTVINENLPVVEPSVTPVTDTNLPVGAIPGQVDVSPTGAATYQIPIEVPAGINGMQPQLSVVYNSQGGMGALGIGWDVSGSSGITRGGRNIYFDKKNYSLELNDNDQLYLDGQRLILLSGTHFQEGAEYGTEIENYAKVKIMSDNTHLYFVVTTNDGKVMEYGKEDNALIKNLNPNGLVEIVNRNKRFLGWKLNKVTDTYGNTMTYTYTENGQYMSRIDYANQSVQFSYNHNLEYSRKSNIRDFSIEQKKLLSSITTTSGSVTHRILNFTYKSDTDYRLEVVSLEASGSAKLNKTVIKWGDSSSGLVANKIGDATDPWLNSQTAGDAYIQFADINGDGYADRLEMWVGRKNEKGHIVAYLYDSNHKTFRKSKTAIIEFDYYESSTYHPQMITSDINNDGKAEVIFLNYKSVYAYKYDNNSNQFLSTFCYADTSQSIDPIFKDDYLDSNKVRLLSMDVNNDNYNDVVIVYGNGKTWGSGFFYGSKSGLHKTLYSSRSDLNAFKNYEIGDFNADGQMDIFGSRCCSDVNPIDDIFINLRFKTDYNLFKDATDENRYSADLNSDGLPDILVQNIDHNSKDCGKWFVYKNDGNFNFSTQALTITNNGGYPLPSISSKDDNNNQLIYFVDYDGDGLLDMISAINFVGYYTPEVHVQNAFRFYRNKGNFVFQFEKYFGNFEGEISNLNSITDINGDGVADFVFAKKINYSDTTPYNYEYYSVSLPNANRKNIVTGITNGMGQVNSFTYKNFSDYNQDGETEDVRNLKSPLLVVDTQTQPDGSVTTYTFKNPKVHIAGKGFLGFSTVTSSNQIHNIRIESIYEFDKDYFGVNLKSQVVSNYYYDKVISSITQTNSVIVIDKDKKRYLPIVTNRTKYDGIKDVSHTTKTNYDLYPQQLTQTEIAGDLTSTIVTDYTGPEGAVPYLPKKVTTTISQNGSTTRVTGYDYVFDKFRLLKSEEKKDPGDRNQVITTTTFDSWGHAQQIAVEANGKIRKTTIGYTPSGRFVASKTNSLGETTVYNWDDISEQNGLLRTETNHWGQKTYYSYDGFGQLNGTNKPDGSGFSSTLQWTTANNARYFTTLLTPGESPVTVWYDVLGREIQRDTRGLKDKLISVYTLYRSDGKIERVSDPVFGDEPRIWNTYAYDPDYGYTTSVTGRMGTTTTAINKLVTSVSTPTEGIKSTMENAAGQTVCSTVNGKSVYYSYAFNSNGSTVSSTPQDGLPVTTTYDLQSRQIGISDPNSGNITSVYNGFGELTEQKQYVHSKQEYVKTTNHYHDNGLMNYIVRENIKDDAAKTVLSSETTNYIYDTEQGHTNRVKTIQLSSDNKQTFSYDSFDRVTGVEETIGNRVFSSAKSYDAYGRVETETYPTGYYTVNHYDANGNMDQVTDGAGRTLWKAVAENAYGQITEAQKGGKTIYYGFDSRGFLNTTESAGVINMRYTFKEDGNLGEKEDYISEHKESYKYDELNRLTNWDVYKKNNLIKQNSIVYNATSGTIKTKSDLGNFDLNYGESNGKPHALTSISGAPTVFPQPTSAYPLAGLEVTYTDFNKIKTLSEMGKSYELTYGVDDQRRKSVYSENGITKLTRYYVGDYEEEVDAVGNVRQIHYLSGAILIRETNKPDKLYYSYSDFQGSLIALTDKDGIVVQRFAYDPWGARRNPNDWTQKDSRTSWLINRGYTGHEHLDQFGIINMNGRVYDPLTAMFFSPDPVLTDAGNWLDYNRYGYCIGNPFRYSDQSGYSWLSDNWKTILTTVVSIGVGIGVGVLTGGLGLVVAGVLAGASSGLVGGALGTALNGGSFGDCFGAAIKGAVIGGFAGAAGGGAVSALGNVGGGFFAGVLQGAVGGAAGGFVGGSLNAWSNGASFGYGLMAGLGGAAIGATAGGLIGGIVGGVDAAANDADFFTGKVFETDLEIGGSVSKRASFLDEEIPAGVKPTETGQIATTESNPNYGKYGMTRNGGTKPHFGTDYVGNEGDNVYAMYDGKVIQIGNSKAYGPNFVRTSSVINGKNYNVDYGHMSQHLVSYGQSVKAGYRIGLMGRMGNLSGTTFPTHVHIAVWRSVQSIPQGFVKPWW